MRNSNIMFPLADNEHVIWSGTPKKSACIITAVLVNFLPLLIFTILFLVLMIRLNSQNNQMAWIFWGSASGIIFITVACGVVFAIIDTKNTHYYVTDKRVVIRNGVWGIHTNSIFYNDLSSISVNYGILNKIFNTATIKLVSFNNFRSMRFLTNAEDVYATISKTREAHKKSNKGN